MITQLRKKISTFTTLLKIKKLQLDSASLSLKKTSEEHKRAVDFLDERKNNYLQGISKVNDLRKNMEHSLLQIFEQTVNVSKEEWIEALKKFKDLEQKLKNQSEIVQKMHKELKSVEKILESKTYKFRQEVESKNQENIDEINSKKSFYEF